MRPVVTPVEGGSVRPSQSDVTSSNLEEVDPAPVFVSQSGRRGRLLRGLGWPVSVVGAILAVVMAGTMVGVQADAPAMGIPPQPTAQPAEPVTTPTPAPSPTPSPKPSTSTSKAPSRSATPAGKQTAKPTGTTGTTGTAGTTGTTGTTTMTGTTGAPHGVTPSARSTKHP